jgi:Leucine-rich repeat (LRR) protein
MVRFATIPKEMLVYILSFLSNNDAFNIASLDTEHRNHLNHPAFWFDPYRENKLPKLDEPVTKEVFIREYTHKGRQLLGEMQHILKFKTEILKLVEGTPHFRKFILNFTMLSAQIESITNFKANLANVDTIIASFNKALINIQAPSATSRYVKLNYITRFTEQWIDDFCERHPQIEFHEDNLLYLELKDSYLSALPYNIGRLCFLEGINLYNTNLKSLPDTLSNLTRLRQFLASDGQFDTIPDVLIGCKSLVSLCLPNMGIKEIPQNIFRLGNLNTLWLMDNEIELCPRTLRNLDSLRVLHLSGNKLVLEQHQAVLSYFKRLGIDFPTLMLSQNSKLGADMPDTELDGLSQSIEGLDLNGPIHLQYNQSQLRRPSLRLPEDIDSDHEQRLDKTYKK